MKRVVRLLRVILSVGKVEFGVCMGGMVVVGGALAGGLGLGDTVEIKSGNLYTKEKVMGLISSLEEPRRIAYRGMRTPCQHSQ